MHSIEWSGPGFHREISPIMARRIVVLLFLVSFGVGVPGRFARADALSADGAQIVDAVEWARSLTRIRALRNQLTVGRRDSELTPLGRELRDRGISSLGIVATDVDGVEGQFPDVRSTYRSFAGRSPNDLVTASGPPPAGEFVSRGTEGEKIPSAGPTALLGLPSESNLVIGLADFLAERAKAEVAYSFLEDLENDMKADPASVASLVPASMAVLEQIDYMGYRQLTPALTAAFHRDLSDLPLRLTGSDTSIRLVKRLTPFQRGALRIGVVLFQDVRNGMSPAVALQDLMGAAADSLQDSSLRAALRLAGSMARDYCVHATDVDLWFQHPEQLRDYVAALALQLASEDPESKPVLDAALSHVETVQSFLTTLHALQTSINQKREAASQNPLVTIGVVLEQVDQLATFTTRLCRDGSAGAVRAFQDQFRFARDLQTAIADGDWSKVAVSIVMLLSKTATDRPYADVRYLVFACNLASAKDPDAVREALSTAAEPVGSFRAKRFESAVPGGEGKGNRSTARTRIGINGYLGPEIALESRRDGKPIKDTTPSFFLSGLIGVEASHSAKASFPSSYSLFLSAFELGNIVAYRATKADDLEKSPELGFRQITAPGVFLILGVSKTRPLSLGLGYQVAPHLRRDLASGDEVDVQRASLFFSLDLPIFKF